MLFRHYKSVSFTLKQKNWLDKKLHTIMTFRGVVFSPLFFLLEVTMKFQRALNLDTIMSSKRQPCKDSIKSHIINTFLSVSQQPLKQQLTPFNTVNTICDLETYRTNTQMAFKALPCSLWSLSKIYCTSEVTSNFIQKSTSKFIWHVYGQNIPLGIP